MKPFSSNWTTIEEFISLDLDNAISTFIESFFCCLSAEKYNLSHKFYKSPSPCLCRNKAHFSCKQTHDFDKVLAQEVSLLLKLTIWLYPGKT